MLFDRFVSTFKRRWILDGWIKEYLRICPRIKGSINTTIMLVKKITKRRKNESTWEVKIKV
ncbi:hypothetical protein GCM10009430_31820 [Aquimarina litoralis]|uniref:Transposase DDE domain-containing protein n=1 Tax=Aquimarina litoralis TaxID=584605 RepID=A0ABN1J1A8_9FLAO